MCYNGCRYFLPNSERCTLPKGHHCQEDVDDEAAAEREREEDEWAYEWAMEQRYARSDDWR